VVALVGLKKRQCNAALGGRGRVGLQKWRVFIQNGYIFNLSAEKFDRLKNQLDKSAAIFIHNSALL
jgi:hypothetical protein